MTNQDEDPKTHLARSLADRKKQFQRQLTEAVSRTASDPAGALLRLEQCHIETDKLEKDEAAFLGRMGEWGLQQLPSATKAWKEIRLQILFGKAQGLLLLGHYDDAQSAIEAARPYVAGPDHPAGAMMDELELAILQAKA